jgi:hypothetical protein
MGKVNQSPSQPPFAYAPIDVVQLVYEIGFKQFGLGAP